jgi:hypothetical protein
VEQEAVVNRRYNLVAKSDLNEKVKFIAVGESDNGASLQRFKATDKVPFPMVPDRDWDIGVDLFPISGTPTTVLVDKSGKVLLVENGVFDSAGALFKKIKAKIK